MGAQASALPVKRGERLFVELAAGPETVREAQALRYRVFGQELGAKLKPGQAGLTSTNSTTTAIIFWSAKP
jgi:putative hemolysin